MSIELKNGRYLEYGNVKWYINGLKHREDGPAVQYSNGSKFWYFNDKSHRLDGPACEWFDGQKEWFINGTRHREDGPAIELKDGSKHWYVFGKPYTEEEFNQWKSKKDLNKKLQNLPSKKIIKRHKI